MKGAVVALVVMVAASASGQSSQPTLPPGMTPPPGMCRIWLDGVPPNLQPAPTECSAAIRTKPPNGTVHYGPKTTTPAKTKTTQTVPPARGSQAKTVPTPPTKPPGRRGGG
jgi:hypothetical protein